MTKFHYAHAYLRNDSYAFEYLLFMRVNMKTTNIAHNHNYKNNPDTMTVTQVASKRHPHETISALDYSFNYHCVLPDIIFPSEASATVRR